MQRVTLSLNNTSATINLPSPESEVIPGVLWGQVQDFPTPAYWYFQVLARRIQGQAIRYRLGSSLKEEVAACLLGGHGIPANVGLAAFNYLKSLGAFSAESPSESQLIEWLSKPLTVNGRNVRYRFAKQKARYLSLSLPKLDRELIPTKSGKDLRDWLIRLPGIGPKTASWIARNWLDADDVAVLDIHLIRAGRLTGFFDECLSVEKDYFQLEKQFIEFSNGLDIRPSELDAVIWYEMASSPASIRKSLNKSANQNSIRRPDQSHSNTDQLPVFA